VGGTDRSTLSVAACDVAAINATAARRPPPGCGHLSRFGDQPAALPGGRPRLSTVDAPPLGSLGAINGTPPYTFVLYTMAAQRHRRGDRCQPSPLHARSFIGDDTFTFLATDLNQFTDIGVVRINVGTSNLNAQSQTVNVPFGATNFPITLVASGGLTPYGLVSIVVPPSGGTLTASGPNSFVYFYTPPLDFLGTDSFTWSVTDSAPAYDEGVVTINVVPGAAATSRIVFASDEGSPGNSDIYVINADGTGKVNLTNSPTVNDYDPSGRRMAPRSRSHQPRRQRGSLRHGRQRQRGGQPDVQRGGGQPAVLGGGGRAHRVRLQPRRRAGNLHRAVGRRRADQGDQQRHQRQ
jgi:hypothetical protein